jgi:mono/diheme cytochrome c family protein
LTPIKDAGAAPASTAGEQGDHAMIRTVPTLAAGLALALALDASAAQAASVNHGRQIAQRNCAMCHAIGASGDSRNPMAPPFRTLGTRYPIEMLAEALAEGMLTGHPEMPQFQFPPKDIDDLIAYIKSVQTKAQVRATPRGPHGTPTVVAYVGGPSSR